MTFVVLQCFSNTLSRDACFRQNERSLNTQQIKTRYFKDFSDSLVVPTSSFSFNFSATLSTEIKFLFASCTSFNNQLVSSWSKDLKIWWQLVSWCVNGKISNFFAGLQSSVFRRFDLTRMDSLQADATLSISSAVHLVSGHSTGSDLLEGFIFNF